MRNLDVVAYLAYFREEKGFTMPPSPGIEGVRLTSNRLRGLAISGGCKFIIPEKDS
jgi:hypothetical protein